MKLGGGSVLSSDVLILQKDYWQKLENGTCRKLVFLVAERLAQNAFPDSC